MQNVVVYLAAIDGKTGTFFKIWLSSKASLRLIHVMFSHLMFSSLWVLVK